MLTDAAIRAAQKRATTLGKSSIELKDKGRRGEGRLALVIRVVNTCVITEWYAVWYRDNRRRSTKIGSYPSLSLLEARTEFRANFAPAISRGEDPKRLRSQSKRGQTFRDMCEAYVEHLQKEGRDADRPRQYLLGSENKPIGRWRGVRTTSAVDAIGENKLASAIGRHDIIPYLREIHARGAVTSASHARAYISAAFSFAMRSANSYHQSCGGTDFGVEINPVHSIPTDPAAKRAGTRHLGPAELRDFWLWLDAQKRRSSAAYVLQLSMSTGQRLTELLALSPDEAAVDYFAAHGIRVGLYNPAEKVISWATTKNSHPHLIPVPAQAFAILDACVPNKSGLFFTRRNEPTRALSVSAVQHVVKRYLTENPSVASFSPRDVRRTWKTLTGAAGLSKEIRDRLQNHARHDISSRHYDRYEYLAEKREAMECWSKYLTRILSGEIDNPVRYVWRSSQQEMGSG